ncbi:MAG: HAD family hydrolase [Gemmatimonadetes bacterium]|nr:HAD family hydrolase [Gemmatimonadota bacterium]
MRPALFCDRDGTLIHDAHYLRDPAEVRLLDGTVELLRACRAVGWALVVVTNQAGIARGLITPAQYEAVRARLDALLAAEGVTLDATYHCPHHPEFTGPCRCRKPGTALYTRPRRDLALDLAQSVWIGDRWHDVAPALVFGGRGLLVPSEDTPADEVARAGREAQCVPDRRAVVAAILPSGSPA